MTFTGLNYGEQVVAMKTLEIRRLKRSWRKLYEAHGDLVRSTAIGATFILGGVYVAKILLAKVL